MSLLLACATGHAALTWVVPSPWGVPDLTVAGLVLTIGRAPRRWLAVSLAAGLLTLIWTVRWAWLVWAVYLALGWSLHTLARVMDVSDRRVQGLAVAAASAVMSGGALWFDQLGRWPLLAAAAGHVAVTTGALLLLHALAGRRLVQ
jgi:hypothetical protein